MPAFRTVDPRKMYDEVDWGLLVFFLGLFIIVGGAERAGWLHCAPWCHGA
jgi:Na+/H+ antiporter NhaD/arsenite permease-like protein